ncbi:MAG TPA: Mov34/MPN/PAD-1 family protein [Blastocatellia bacterium]|nr:Mov34/MPN/PAD-1 family protein [Blastocatellia bacterium]
MKRDKTSRPENKAADPPADQTKSPGAQAPDSENIALGEWADRRRPVRRTFPGPGMLDVALRVAMDRSPYAELIAHAKESLHKEICGVLVGDVCEDDQGSFVHIKAIIRGDAAQQGSTHVTYTQETWTAIHKTMEERYRKLQIVGWYHSHPGYGVQFSEMDRFIQKNFFFGPTQLGLVIDPLGGDVSICVNTDAGLENIGQFWVDGREQRCYLPAPVSSATATSSGPASAELQQRLESVENRLNQAIRALDDTRTYIYRVVLSMGMLIGVSVVAAVGYSIYSSYFRPMTPPEIRSYAPVPIKIGDKVVLLGVGVVSWEVPPELIPTPREPEQKSDKNGSASDVRRETPGQSDQPAGGPGNSNSEKPASPDAGSSQPQGSK